MAVHGGSPHRQDTHASGHTHLLQCERHVSVPVHTWLWQQHDSGMVAFDGEQEGMEVGGTVRRHETGDRAGQNTSPSNPLSDSL